MYSNINKYVRVEIPVPLVCTILPHLSHRWSPLHGPVSVGWTPPSQSQHPAPAAEAVDIPAAEWSANPPGPRPWPRSGHRHRSGWQHTPGQDGQGHALAAPKHRKKIKWNKPTTMGTHEKTSRNTKLGYTEQKKHNTIRMYRWKSLLAALSNVLTNMFKFLNPMGIH